MSNDETCTPPWKRSVDTCNPLWGRTGVSSGRASVPVKTTGAVTFDTTDAPIVRSYKGLHVKTVTRPALTQRTPFH